MRVFHSLLFAISFSVLCAAPATAHEIPSDVTVHAFVKPEKQRLQLLVRVPLAAIRDVDFPTLAGGYLNVEKLEPLLPDAATLWISNFVELYEDDTLLPRPKVLATQISLESDRSFSSFDQAVSHITGPKLSNSANVVWNQVLFDVLFEYPIRSDQANFSIRPGLERLGARVATVLRFLPPGGSVLAYEFQGDSGLIQLDPRWHQAAWRFVQLGFHHILDGIDHLLFLLCLVIPFRRFRGLIAVVTAFTAAHSVTLIASAFDYAPNTLWFPPFVETLIAISIVYMALENIAGGATVQRRWRMAFAFGLVHGFGFSFALKETLQFAGSHLLTSLLSFNVGVELGQLLVIMLLVPLLEALFHFVVSERTGTIILSALVAHTGWHWMIERADHLRQFRIDWQVLSGAVVAFALLGVISLMLLTGAMRAVRWLLRQAEPAFQRRANG